MNDSEIRQTIEAELKRRKKKVFNGNAYDALFAALPAPLSGLGKLFLGRSQAIDREKTVIVQDIILQLLLNIDNAISAAIEQGKTEDIDWKVICGMIEAYGEDVGEVTGMSVSPNVGPVELKPGTHIKASGKNVGRITGLKIGGTQSEKEDT
jgi:hypothetical protein